MAAGLSAGLREAAATNAVSWDTAWDTMEALVGSVRTFLTVSSSSYWLGSQSLSAAVRVLAGDEGGGEVELRLPKFTPFLGNLRVPVDWVDEVPITGGGGVTLAYLRRC